MTVRDLIPPPLVFVIVVVCGAALYLTASRSDANFVYTSGQGIVRQLTPENMNEDALPERVSIVALTRAAEIVRARPLLLPDRQPWVAAPIITPETSLPIQAVAITVPAPEPAPEIVLQPNIPEYRMSGTMVNGDKTMVLLADQNTDKEIWLESGALLEGWKIEEIHRDYIILRFENHEYTLQLIP